MKEVFRTYETVYILRPDLATDQLNQVHTRVRDVIEANGGIFQKQEFWGKRTLAYPIKRQRKGIYVLVQFVGATGGLTKPGTVKELERVLQINENLLRFQTVVLDDRVDPASVSAIDRAPIFEGELPPDEPPKPPRRSESGGHRSERAPASAPDAGDSGDDESDGGDDSPE